MFACRVGKSYYPLIEERLLRVREPVYSPEIGVCMNGDREIEGSFMSDSAQFNVVCTGEFRGGKDPQEVIAAFAKVAKIDAKKASAIVYGKHAIKKSIDHGSAYRFKTKLEGLGLGIALQRVKPSQLIQGLALQPIEAPSDSPSVSVPSATSTTPMELALDPIEKEEPDSTPVSVLLAENEMLCPKCNLQQPKAVECAGCGVIVAKVAAALEENSASFANGTRTEAAQAEPMEAEGPSTVKVLVAASIAAFVGALAWKFIAVTFNYELGMVAWAIGGLIGAAAVYYGAEGENAGYLCGVLALVAILGGKYLVASAFTESYFNDIQSEMSQEDLDAAATGMRDMAQLVQTALENDDNLREFLVEYEYVPETHPDEISQYVVDTQREQLEVVFEDMEPMLQMNSGDDLEGALGSFATTEVFKASFGWLDLLFLLLGVSTAYRMAAEGSFQLMRRS